MLKQRVRITRLDVGLLVLLAAGATYLGYWAVSGLEYDWNWSVIGQYIIRHDPERGWVSNAILQGLFTTIRLSVWATILATILGTVLGLCRTSNVLFLQLCARTYVGFIRNLPPLVLIFVFYFFLSDQIMIALDVDGFVRSRPDWLKSVLSVLFDEPRRFTAFISALLTITIYEAAYISEIVRAGIESVERGQWEAAYALGLSPWQRMRHVILPLTAQRVMPPLAGQFISTIKDSAIVSVISIQELTFQGMQIMASTYRTYEIWITVAVLYLLLTLTCSLLARKLELYLQRSEA